MQVAADCPFSVSGVAQHGLRHGDYQRDSQLYKSLDFTHGMGNHVKKPITEATVTDVRYLHIVLHLAERAWSYAMELKQARGTSSSRKRIHLICRLSKAERWGHLVVGWHDYAAYMKDNLLLEREDDWDKALRNFKDASRALYEELGKCGDVENQVLCWQHVYELDSRIWYCNCVTEWKLSRFKALIILILVSKAVLD